MTKVRTPQAIDQDYDIVDMSRCRLFADNHDRLWVPLSHSGINPLAAAFDGIPMMLYRKKPYMLVEDAIAWHTRELDRTHERSGSEQNRAVLSEILRRHRARVQGRVS
jgi:hypothetical protein